MKHAMRWLPIMAAVSALFTMGTVSCRYAPKDEPGDTVAASVFEPVDTSSAAYKAKHKPKVVVDSVGIYVVGEASDRHQLQLISYPSRRDTTVFARKRRVKVTGNADIGHLVRITLGPNSRGDTVVTEVTEVVLPEAAKPAE